MKKYVVIPDIHCRKFWMNINPEDYEKIIFLGDLVDPYPEEEDLVTPQESIANVFNLAEKYKDKVEILLGNHGYHYIFDRAIQSTRFDKKIASELREMYMDDLDKIKLAISYDNKIFSHAGIVDGWLDVPLENAVEYLNEKPISEYIDKLNQISFYRGGWYSKGSCIWADVREHLTADYNPIKYPIYQVFGHTRAAKPIITEYFAMLDCSQIFEYEIGKTDV